MFLVSDEIGYLSVIPGGEYLGFAGGRDVEWFWVSVQHFNEVLDKIRRKNAAVMRDCTSKIIEPGMFSRAYLVEKTGGGLRFCNNLVSFERMKKMREYLIKQNIELVDLSS